jgi:hypothetical protein
VKIVWAKIGFFALLALLFAWLTVVLAMSGIVPWFPPAATLFIPFIGITFCSLWAILDYLRDLS